MEKIFYLSGMPRSGSTLLGSILSQHNDVFVTPTSPLNRVMHDLFESLQNNTMRGIRDIDELNSKLFYNLVKIWYDDVPKKYVFDKSRGWGFNIQAIQAFIDPDPRVIITKRPLEDVISSFVVLIEKDPKNHIDRSLYSDGKKLTTENRAMAIWDRFKDYGFKSTKIAVEQFSDIIHIVDYDNLINNTEEVMNGVWNYLDVPKPIHTFDNIECYLNENDENWGIQGLHVVRSKIEKTSKPSIEIIGEELTDFFKRQDNGY